MRGRQLKDTRPICKTGRGPTFSTSPRLLQGSLRHRVVGQAACRSHTGFLRKGQGTIRARIPLVFDGTLGAPLHVGLEKVGSSKLTQVANRSTLCLALKATPPEVLEETAPQIWVNTLCVTASASSCMPVKHLRVVRCM